MFFPNRFLLIIYLLKLYGFIVKNPFPFYLLLLMDGCFFICLYAALIPLNELSDPIIMKKYGVKPDSETLDIVNTAAKQKQVRPYLL